MGILKSVFKNRPLSPYTMLRTHSTGCQSFAHSFSTLLRGGRGYKHEIALIAVFPINL